MARFALLGSLKFKEQRLLFVLACFALVPWIWMRLIQELWMSDGVLDYLGNVFVTPVVAWVRTGWWELGSLPWYDCIFAPALVVLLVSLAWPVIGRPVLDWIRQV